MTTSPIEEMARAIVDDGRLDRAVLRRRWIAPSWRAEIERIVAQLERHPLLIPSVEKHIEVELRRWEIDIAAQPPEDAADADRQEPTVPDV